MKGFNTTIPGKVTWLFLADFWPWLDFEKETFWGADTNTNTNKNPQVVENKYQSGVPEREALQDWDLREVVKYTNKYNLKYKYKYK